MQEIPKYLPPNLQPPTNKQTLPLLTIIISSINTNPSILNKPSFIRYKWWGLGNNKQFMQSIQKNQHQFYISVSVPMFLRYCHDMKVLQLELCDRVGVCTARGWINWLLLDKLWDGRQIQTRVQLKSYKKQNQCKVGQMKIFLKIQQANNPTYIKKEQQQNISNIKVINTTEKNNYYQHISHENQNNNRHTRPKIRQQSIHSSNSQNQAQNNNFINYKFNPYQTQQQKQNPNSIQYKYTGEKKKNEKLNTKSAIFRKLDLPLPDNCICEQIKPNKFAIQKLKLKQQLDLFFNRQYAINQLQQIEIRLLKWQPLSKTDNSLPCKIDMPIIDQNGKIFLNQYSFKKSQGQINIQIDSLKNNQKAIQQYLTNNDISIYVGDCFMGNIPLFKVIGSQGQIISIGIYDRRNKKQVLKGHIFLKLVIKPKKVQKQQKNIKNPQQNSNQIKKPSAFQPVNKPTYSFIWIFLQQLHFLQPKFWENSNIFAVLKPFIQSKKLDEQPKFSTKTIWNSSTPIFNEIIVMPIQNKDNISIQIWNRSNTERIVGKAKVDVNNLEFKMEIPVVDGFNRTIGYLGLCVGNGDIRQATQFLNTHSKAVHNRNNNTKQQPKEVIPRPQQNQSQQNHSQPEIRPQQLTQSDSSSNNLHILPLPIPFLPPIKAPNQQLSALQSHNKIFTTYLFREYDWLQNYQNKHPTIAQFSQLIKPICQLKNISKFLSIYLNTTSNTVQLQQIKQSIQAFSVYYQILVQERNKVLEKVINQLVNEGVNFIQIQNTLKNYKKQQMWRNFKQFISPKLLQSLRYFYQQSSISQICDSLRKFEVYQTTKGQQIPLKILKKQILKQICQLLEIDPHTHNLRSAIKQAGLQLSKFQLLCIFDEIPKSINNKMIKSPTFGFLNTDRLPPPIPKQIKIENNPSIDQFTQHRQSLSGLSEKFGHPNISPINKNTANNNTKNNKKIHINFMDLDGMLQRIYVNGRIYDLQEMQLKTNGQIIIQGQKKFNYVGYVEVEEKGKIQFQGPAQEWISLVGEEGQYCGCVIFQ